jgi:hypothetical protein
MNAKFQNQSDEIRDLTDTLMSQATRITAEAKRALSEREKRYLEYFWNAKTQALRRSLHESIISFFESEMFDESQATVISARVRADLMMLEGKGYIEPTKYRPYEYKLTGDGVGFLKDVHPRLIVLLDRLWDRTPRFLALTVAIVGLVASIFGIIQFVFWLVKK